MYAFAVSLCLRRVAKPFSLAHLPRADAVDSQALAAKLDRHGLSQTNHAVLAGDISAIFEVVTHDAKSIARCHVNARYCLHRTIFECGLAKKNSCRDDDDDDEAK